jgi:diguanylate cyclase (GGDEF)-like protein
MRQPQFKRRTRQHFLPCMARRALGMHPEAEFGSLYGMGPKRTTAPHRECIDLGHYPIAVCAIAADPNNADPIAVDPIAVLIPTVVGPQAAALVQSRAMPDEASLKYGSRKKRMKRERLPETIAAVTAPHAGVADLAGTALGAATDSLANRFPTLAEMEKLTRALTLSREEANAARRKIESLIQTISLLTQNVNRLEQEVAHVHHYAYHDELTGLPNRSLLRDRLNQALVQAARQNKQVGLLLLDLDGFKNVNDRLGHATGDKLLQRVAQRLLACIRGGDTACRYGGDEFVILLPEIDSEKKVADVAQKLRAHLAQPYTVDDQAISVTSSIGVAVYPGDGNTQDDLLRRADVAMYLAKARNNASMRSG